MLVYTHLLISLEQPKSALIIWLKISMGDSFLETFRLQNKKKSSIVTFFLNNCLCPKISQGPKVPKTLTVKNFDSNFFVIPIFKNESSKGLSFFPLLKGCGRVFWNKNWMWWLTVCNGEYQEKHYYVVNFMNKNSFCRCKIFFGTCCLYFSYMLVFTL